MMDKPASHNDRATMTGPAPDLCVEPSAQTHRSARREGRS